TGANLQHANLAGAHLQHANLAGANLQHANLTCAYLQDVNLTGTQLQHANLGGAQLQNTSLARARLKHANLAGIRMACPVLAGSHWVTRRGRHDDGIANQFVWSAPELRHLIRCGPAVGHPRPAADTAGTTPGTPVPLGAGRYHQWR